MEKVLGRNALNASGLEPVQLGEFINDIASSAILEASAKGVRLDVRNLLQNAFTFTRPETAVTLRVQQVNVNAVAGKASSPTATSKHPQPRAVGRSLCT